MNMLRIYLISDASWSFQALQTYSTAAERRKAAHLKAEGECSWLNQKEKSQGPRALKNGSKQPAGWLKLQSQHWIRWSFQSAKI